MSRSKVASVNPLARATRTRYASVMRDGALAKRGLRRNRRTDFGRIQPKWFIPIGEPARTPPPSD